MAASIRQRNAGTSSMVARLMANRSSGTELFREQDRKHFFFEKKKQKTLTLKDGGSVGARAKVQKFFGSFFQKRTPLLLQEDR
jgi:hypothetical protein